MGILGNGARHRLLPTAARAHGPRGRQREELAASDGDETPRAQEGAEGKGDDSRGLIHLRLPGGRSYEFRVDLVVPGAGAAREHGADGVRAVGVLGGGGAGAAGAELHCAAVHGRGLVYVRSGVWGAGDAAGVLVRAERGGQRGGGVAGGPVPGTHLPVCDDAVFPPARPVVAGDIGGADHVVGVGRRGNPAVGDGGGESGGGNVGAASGVFGPVCFHGGMLGRTGVGTASEATSRIERYASYHFDIAEEKVIFCLLICFHCLFS